jgi:hypothetical protein
LYLVAAFQIKNIAGFFGGGNVADKIFHDTANFGVLRRILFRHFPRDIGGLRSCTPVGWWPFDRPFDHS